MGTKIRILLAVVVIFGVSYWAFNSARARSYSGARLDVQVGDGHIVVNNRGTEPVPVEMRTTGRASTFRVSSAELDLLESSGRMGSGRGAYQGLTFELPPGEAQINVVRGTGVRFISSSSQRLDTIVTPKSAESVRGMMTFVGIVILAALYYISRTLEHRWLKNLISRIPRRKRGATAA